MTERSGRTTLPGNRPLHARRRLLLAAVAPLSYLVFLLMRQVTLLAEFYHNSISPIVIGVLSAITGIFPFAVGELLVAAILGFYVAMAIAALARVRRGAQQLKNALADAGLRLARDAGLLVGLFYLLWGFNYALPPLTERLDWPALGEVTRDELTQLAEETTHAANAAYVRIHGVADAGSPTTLPEDREALEDALLTGWSRARERLQMPTRSHRLSSIKTPLLTALYEWIGVAGFYFPYTAEANVRAGLPAIDYPKILAHEMTHQRGVAQESEANFWAYLAAVHSDELLAQYSAMRFAYRQMVSELARLDVSSALQMARYRLPGVQRDIDHSRRYWRRFQGRGTALGSAVNNAFLRSNRVEGGIRSYSMSVRLFLSYARANHGELVPELKSGRTADR